MPQSLSAVYLHSVFSTKDRRPFLRDLDLRVSLHAYMGGISKKLECAPLRIGGVEDHVHILSRLGRTITHDSLNRPAHRRDSRTAVTNTTCLSDTADFVESVSDPGARKTQFTYDIRGRRTHVDAPDTFDLAGGPTNTDFGNITVTRYFPDGRGTKKNDLNSKAEADRGRGTRSSGNPCPR